MAESFANAVAPFDPSQLAKAANRTKETARQWKTAAKAPNAASLINMARKIPAVDAWLRYEIGRQGEVMDYESAQFYDAVQRAVERRKP